MGTCKQLQRRRLVGSPNGAAVGYVRANILPVGPRGKIEIQNFDDLYRFDVADKWVMLLRV